MGSRKVRFSKQQQQEYRSRDQLADRFGEHGWVSEQISRDLGEDLLVNIYDQGVFSGLAFLVQLKSTENLEGFAIRGNHISYQLEVADLERWETSAIPVLIIIWDVSEKTGCWISVADAIADLDARKPKWRSQKTVRVRIPCSNGMDDVGLRRMRQAIAKHYYPVIAQGKALEIKAKFVFPPTPEGQTARKALERHFAAGEVAEIDGQFIQELRFPEWWTRTFGKIDPSKGRLVLGPGKSEHPVPVRLDLTPPGDRSATIPYVDLRIIRGGFDEVTLSNEHQPIPLHFVFVFRESDHHFRMTFKVAGPGANVCETRDIVSFIDALARGGKLRITFRDTDRTFEVELPGGHADAPGPEVLDLIEKLCLIQQRTGCTLSLDPDWSLSKQDIQTINELATIIETGRVVKHNTIITGKFRKAALELMLDVHRTGKPISLMIEGEECWMELLGVKISLGPYRERISGVLDISVAEIEQTIADMGADDELEVKLVKAQAVEEFMEWLREDETVDNERQ